MQFDGSDKYICKGVHVAVEEINECNFSNPSQYKYFCARFYRDLFFVYNICIK